MLAFPREGKMRLVMATASKTVYSHITKDPEVCGGKACIDGTRIRVIDIVSLKRQRYSPEKMLEAYPSLNLAQVYSRAALPPTSIPRRSRLPSSRTGLGRPITSAPRPSI
jgi:uncharacterized protein (DUF433 family)